MKGTIPLEEAARLSGPRMIDLMVKPVGSLCNLGCSYCYYADKVYKGTPMSLSILETVVRSYFQAQEGPELSFVWHGGEPLLAGLDFYRKAVELQRRYADGRVVRNAIQTNGTLLTDDWAAFFRENDFLVGISIDGPRDLHDHYRQNKGGGASFSGAMAGLALLKKHGVAFNTLSTVNHASAGRGAEVYGFLKSIGSHYMQFLPVVEQPWAVSAVDYGRFMVDIFDVWVREDIGRYYVQLFDSTLAAWCGLPAAVCTLGRTCSGNAVVEHNGDVYVCDHCVNAASRLGNIMETPLEELLAQDAVKQFAYSKYAGLPPRCLRCQYLPACNGECPQHRHPDTGVNALCEGYQLFFDHAAPTFDQMRSRIVDR